ncbi:hypothetical protein DTO271G3_1028 [Paecilomyces variotii]|nr:hypothetical protein DTO271G3_1028 [Paecilomyces variotii]
MVFTPSPRRLAVSSYHSPYAPKYAPQPHFHGITTRHLFKAGTVGATFGISAGIFALFFFGEVPRVRKDILQKVPVLGEYFDRSIPPEDNPF